VFNLPLISRQRARASTPASVYCGWWYTMRRRIFSGAMMSERLSVTRYCVRESMPCRMFMLYVTETRATGVAGTW
jgi:hypothetical protein